jgi:hypothetical protein
LRPSGLTATELGPASPTAGAQVLGPWLATHPAGPLAWVSLPVLALRRKIAIALLLEEAT